MVIWGIGSTAWLLNSFRTRGVEPTLLESNAQVSVRDTAEHLAFLPTAAGRGAGLVFITGGGVAAEAYAPLLRPIAERGHPVFVIRLPWRLAPLESHKRTALSRAVDVLEDDSAASRWVIAGHSLGAALATRLAGRNPPGVIEMVLVGTTHPKEMNLRSLPFAATKVFASNDGVAPVAAVEANRHLLPDDTRWIRIEGGNHSQFGHYGSQLFDDAATISRSRQQELTREVLLAALSRPPE